MFSRPDQVGWWFRIGCRNFKKLPSIPSLPNYEKFWICWWSSLQPDWRCIGDWPLACDAGGTWDKLLIGGKDGLFIVVMTLAWWITEYTNSGGEDSELEEAIKDVSWVLSNLVSVLSTRDANRPSSTLPLPPHLTSPSVPASGGSKYRSQQVAKIGPPRKRLHFN